MPSEALASLQRIVDRAPQPPRTAHAAMLKFAQQEPTTSATSAPKPQPAKKRRTLSAFAMMRRVHAMLLVCALCPFLCAGTAVTRWSAMIGLTCSVTRLQQFSM